MSQIICRNDEKLTLDGDSLSIEQFYSAAAGEASVQVSDDPALASRMHAASELVNRAINESWRVYGVTSGFGGLCNLPVPRTMAAELQRNLLAFLACAAGPPISNQHTRGAMLLRAHVLLKGRSGIRLEIVERLVKFLQAGATPVVRILGSIGASGDLVPLSTIARSICGNLGNVRVQLNGRDLRAEQVLSELGLKSISLQPKEGLALVNGTSFSAAIAANSVYHSRRILALAVAANAIMSRALNVQCEPFNEFVHQCKPHPGQVWAAAQLRRLLDQGPPVQNGHHDNLQDCYSLRCMPQYFGPIVESMARIGQTIEIEMNSISDNPLVEAEQGRFHPSGNFLGQSIAMAMDELRRNLGLIAKQLDVQIAQLVAPEFNRGLPASLRGNDQKPFNMGVKGLQITGNSIMPMLTYYANPLVTHFPTHAEQFNQNVNGLSWGSANLAWQSVQLSENHLAVAMIIAAQAIDLRSYAIHGHYDGRSLLSSSATAVYEATLQAIDVSPGEERPLLFDDVDRWLEQDIDRIVGDIRQTSPLTQSIKELMKSFTEFEAAYA